MEDLSRTAVAKRLADELGIHMTAQGLSEAVASSALTAADPALVAEVGFRGSVAFSRAAWDRCIAVTPRAEEMGCDIVGRQWDALSMLRGAVRRAEHDAELIPFRFLAVADRDRAAHLVELYALVADPERQHLLVVSATEALGPERGAVVDRFLGLFGIDDEDPEETP